MHLVHRPWTCDALDGKEQRIAPIDAMNGVNDVHQSGLPHMIVDGVFTEQIRLYHIQRCDLAEIDPAFLVAETFAIHRLETLERMSNQVRCKCCGMEKMCTWCLAMMSLC